MQPAVFPSTVCDLWGGAGGFAGLFFLTAQRTLYSFRPCGQTILTFHFHATLQLKKGLNWQHFKSGCKVILSQ